MNDQDRQAIDGLFQRLAEVERRSPPRDADAEGFIRQEIARQSGAPYFMAQTIVMQDYALQQAQARIAELEQQAEEQARAYQQAQQAPQQPASGGGFFGGLFGSSQQPAPRGGSVPSFPRQGAAAGGGSSGAWGNAPGAAPMGYGQPGQQPGMAQPGMAPGGMAQPGMAQGGFGRGGGGGFLAGAAQTAMGVAGGVLLGNAIAGMFGGHEAKAATPEPAQDMAQDDAADQPADDAGAADDSGGGFFDDFFGGGSEEL